jgi:palmitoyl transferase
MIKKLVITALITTLPYINAFADTPSEGMWSDIKSTLSDTWDASSYELYLPINTWHNRHYYSQEKINGYNEQPWGLGVGKYRYDEDGDWHGVYVMAFTDSHSKVQPVAGYAFQKMWRPNNDIRVGAGYTLGVTLREDFNYMPLPVIAPVASIEYKQLALQSTYIFGGKGNGNILFTWIKWQID